MMAIQAFDVQSPHLELHLRRDPKLKQLLDESLFIGERGAGNYIFPNLLGQASSLPEMQVKVVGWLDGQVAPTRARCIVASDKGVQRFEPEPAKGAVTFSLARSQQTVSAMLLLAFKIAPDWIEVSSRDEFGRTFMARWPEEA
jgi:hypothetical protein